MADNVTNTIVNDFVSNSYGLFRVAGIIVFHADQFIAFNSAFGIDISNSLTCTGKFHVTILGNRAGHRANNGNFNVFRQHRMAHRHCYTPRQQHFTFC